LSATVLEGNPDFVKLAESYGAAAIQIDTPDEVDTKLKQALAINDRPVLINAEVTPSDNVFPMIPAGARLEDMLIKPTKAKLAKPTGST